MSSVANNSVEDTVVVIVSRCVPDASKTVPQLMGFSFHILKPDLHAVPRHAYPSVCALCLLAGRRGAEEDREGDADARGSREAAGGVFQDGAGPGGRQEPPDLQCSHSGPAEPAAADQEGASLRGGAAQLGGTKLESKAVSLIGVMPRISH